MQCVETGIGKVCSPIPGPCVPEGKRIRQTQVCCEGLKPFGGSDKLSCLKLGAVSTKGQVCSELQKCDKGLFCKAGNCETLPTCIDQSVPCNTFASHDALKNIGCCGELKCLPFNGVTVCQKLPQCYPEGAYCENAMVGCCAGNTCETHTDDKTGKRVQQCRKTGETADRHQYEEDKKKEEMRKKGPVGTVTSFTLIRTDTEQVVAVIKPDDIIDLQMIGTNQLSIRADTAGFINSVVFDFDAKTTFRIEGSAPYSLGSDENGDYKPTPQLAVLGKHTVSATPYSDSNAKGVKGGKVSVSFIVK
jgi:hypothetical protein